MYVNNLGDEGEDRVRAAYGANYPRLAEVKRAYDPDNVFRLNQNIAAPRPDDDGQSSALAHILAAAPAETPDRPEDPVAEPHEIRTRE
ncbi:MAG: BBE domain-containing protein [Pseudonocardia sp.]